MADYQAITQGIRAYLRSGTREYTEDLPDLASGYAALCREANQRMRRCVEYARRGALPEAAHLANCQPDLVQLATALRFPELKAWVETCAAHNLQRPPALTDGLNDVKAALKRDAALAPLLARHRLLALAKAPAGARLAVVRLLSKHDADNRGWADEARRIEPVRLAEMSAAAQLAAQADDAEALGRLWDELSAHAWESPVPEELAGTLDAVGRDQRRAAASEEFAELTARLEDLLQDPSSKEAAVDAAAGRWTTLLAEYRDEVDPTLAERLPAAVDAWKAERARERQVADERLMSKLFQPANRAGQDPYANFNGGRWWVKPLGIAVALLMMAGSGVAYLATRPSLWARIRVFLAGNG